MPARARGFLPPAFPLSACLRVTSRLALAILLAGFAASAAAWPAVEGDLPADPAVRAGTLSNGLRYVIRPNREPRDRIALRLVVDAGSLQERDDERGLAHFVEHMVFRGTRRHPNGSLAAELQRLGVGPGPENTAFTHLDHTIYHLELPDTREATLRQGLGIFREYAEDVTFEPALIERERGVVLSERDTRDTPDARTAQANLAFLWPAARQVERNPIGTEAAVRTFTRAQFVSFYDAWYRPERLAVIIVGEIDPAVAERLVADVFSSLQARGPARTDPVNDVPASASPSDVRVFSDPGLIGASCTFEHPVPEPRTADTRARRALRLRQSLAFAMFQRRVTYAARRAGAQFVAPSAQLARHLPGWALASFGVSGTTEHWREFIADLEREHRRALLQGFTAAELDLARTSFITAYADAVRTSATWPSDWIAGQLARNLVDGAVFATPHALQADALPLLAAVTPAECTAAFRAAWSTQAPHVFLATHPAFYVPPVTIAETLNASRSVPLPPREETIATAFAYSFGPPGTVAAERQHPDLEVWQARFANGVRLNFKPTPFEAGTVEAFVRIGVGRLSQPLDQPGLDLLANLLVPRGGLGRHTLEELQDLLAQHSVTINFAVDHDALTFSARGAPRDLAFALAIIAAHLTDAAYRPDALREIQASFGSMYASLASSAGGPIAFRALRVLTGDRRFGTPTPDELGARTISEVTTWLEPQFKRGPIELSIVGDTTWENARDAVAATLGALPARDERPAHVVPGPVAVRGKPEQAVYVSTTDPQLRQVALSWFCPVPDLADVHHERRCRLLAEVLNERLRVHLREELGAAYSCTAQFVQFDGFPQLSYFNIFTEVAPADAERANRVIRDQIEIVRRGRFDDDEFERAKAPFIRARQDDLRSNGYWGYTVLRDAQQRPERLAAARDRAKDTASIRRAEIASLARRYFKLARWFQFVAYPRSPAPGAPSSAPR